MRNLINIIALAEDPTLKKSIVDLVKSTDDASVLHKVLKVLKAGNIEDRVVSVLSKDADASKFLQKLAEIISTLDAPIEEKDEFLRKYPKGIADTSLLLSGKPVTFSEFLGGSNFAVELFKVLTPALTSQGVGPGEVALAVLSPKIAWSGRAVGGGDIQIDGKAVELKTTVSSGGRWINPRKANMDLASIKKTLMDAENSVLRTLSGNKEVPHREMPDRLSIPFWTNELRPVIGQDMKLLQACAKVMADGLFNQTNNKEYQQALIHGGEQDIQDALLKVGFNNYKAYSKFDGIMLMDLKGELAQYFTEFEQMAGRIKVDTTYLYGPEGEVMPKVSLLATGGDNISNDGGGHSTSSDSAPVAVPKAVTGKSVTAKDLSMGPGAKAAKADVGGIRARR